MKKYVISIIILLLIAISLLIVLMMSNSSSKNLEDLINDLVKSEEKLITLDNYYNPNEYKLIPDDVSGLVSVAVFDFDGDKENEVLISRIKNNDLVLYFYKVQDEKLVETYSIVLLNEFLNSPDTINMDLFMTLIDDVPYLFIESTGYSNLVADGINWDFRKIGFSNSKFIKINQKSVAGSYFDDEDISEYKRIVKEAGLKIDYISFEDNGKTLLEQNEKVFKIFSIKREHIKDFDASDYYDSKETKVKYGITTFDSTEENIVYIVF